MKEDKFKAETKTYYVSVPNETEQIRMDVSSSEKPTVTVNSASVNVTASDTKSIRQIYLILLNWTRL